MMNPGQQMELRVETPPCAYQSRIDALAEAAITEVRAMGAAARSHINRSLGQAERRMRERLERGV